MAKKKASKKKPLHGIAKAEHINAKRSKNAKIADKSKSSKHTMKKATDANIKKWGKNPGKSDMKGVDTKRPKKNKKK